MEEYKPFKMKGHTLPGINQRSEGNTDLPDGRSGSAPLQKHVRGHNNPDPDREFLKGLTGDLPNPGFTEKLEPMPARPKPKYKAYKRTVIHKRPKMEAEKKEGKILKKAKKGTIEKAMKEATLYEGFKKMEGKKDKPLIAKRAGTLVARKKAKLVEKPKKKTGKISTKTMELE